MNNLNTHVPKALGELDAVAGMLVSSVNALHVTGQGLDPIADVGLNFWDPTGTTASTIRVSADVANDPSRIAAAVAGAGDLDSSLAQQIAALHNSPGGADSLYQDMIGRLAVETQAATRRVRHPGGGHLPGRRRPPVGLRGEPRRGARLADHDAALLRGRGRAC